MLSQLIYTSRAACPFTLDELADLLSRSRIKNTRLGVTGMLVHDRGQFLQILEGRLRAIEPLYDRIAKDPRHDHMALLAKLPVDKRVFEDWSMGFYNADRFKPEALTGFHDFFGKDFSVARFGSEPALAKRLLVAFREGQWRDQVDTGNAAAPIAPGTLNAIDAGSSVVR